MPCCRKRFYNNCNSWPQNWKEKDLELFWQPKVLSHITESTRQHNNNNKKKHNEEEKKSKSNEYQNIVILQPKNNQFSIKIKKKNSVQRVVGHVEVSFWMG